MEKIINPPTWEGMCYYVYTRRYTDYFNHALTLKDKNDDIKYLGIIATGVIGVVMSVLGVYNSPVIKLLMALWGY